MTDDELKKLVASARARYEALDYIQKASHDDAQRESWVRGMTARCEHGVLDFEQCPDCRAGASSGGPNGGGGQNSGSGRNT